jgi:hypothetical protein
MGKSAKVGRAPARGLDAKQAPELPRAERTAHPLGLFE